MDTGAAVTVMSERVKDQLFPNMSLEKSSLRLRTYTGEVMAVLGETTAQMKYGDQHCTMSLTVVAGSGPCLLGRDWLSQLKLDWKTIAAVRADLSESKLDALLSRYAGV